MIRVRNSIDEQIQHMARRIAAEFDPDQIILFGSHARGEAGADSDVDLLVEFEPAFQAGAESQTAAVWLKAAGYRTALFGKYLNGYPSNFPAEYVPPGWDDWQVQLTTLENGRYFNYQMNENGRIVAYGQHPEDYDTDVLARKAVDFNQN